MKPTQYALPPESIVDLAFQFNKVNYNLHVDTHDGLISLELADSSDKSSTHQENLFTKLLN